MQQRMKRVNRTDRCPVCGKPDWCLVAPDKTAAICARVEQGAVKRCGDAGWLHVLHNEGRRHPCGCHSSRVLAGDEGSKHGDQDFCQLAAAYSRRLTDERLAGLSAALGVSGQSLRRLNVGWDGRAYTFPMSNDFARIVGIRRRFPNGRKASLKGGRTGLFVPAGLGEDGRLLICEGPTDTAAALDFGFDAIGRPNCNSQIEMTARAARGRREIIVVGDSDEAGRAGAKRLGSALALHYPCVKVISPPIGLKDLRQWLRAGLTHEMLLNEIQDAGPIALRITFTD